MVTNSGEEPAASSLMVKDGGSRFIQNVDTFLQALLLPQEPENLVETVEVFSFFVIWIGVLCCVSLVTVFDVCLFSPTCR
jgi:hypothetical protein